MTQPDPFYARCFAVATTVVLAVALYMIVAPFLQPLFWALFIAFLLHPLHLKLTQRLRNRPQASAALLTIATLVMLLGPLTALSAAFAAQVADLVAYTQSLIPGEAAASLLHLDRIPIVGRALGWLNDSFGVTTAQIQGWAIEGARELLHGLAGISGKLFLGAIGTVVGFGIMLFMLFFVIRDGAETLATARELIPMTPARRQALFDHLAAVTRAVVFGTGLTSLIQGALVGIAFAIVGLPSPLVFGVIAALFALLPFAGTALVWAPAALILAAQQRWFAALFMLLWGTLLVSMVDNVLRPLLISGRAQVATLTVFVGVLGGASAFGFIGLFLGPVVLALIIALIRFSVELRRTETQS